jgi:hypothetical protein
MAAMTTPDTIDAEGGVEHDGHAPKAMAGANA